MLEGIDDIIDFEWYKANKNDGQQENGFPMAWSPACESFNFGLTLSESFTYMNMLQATYLLRLMERTASLHMYKMVWKSSWFEKQHTKSY